MNSPSESSNVHVVARVLLVVLISALLARFFGKLYAACQSFRTLKKLGMPVAPHHSWVFGHLLFVKRIIDSMPRDAHRDLALGEILRRYYPSEGIVYLDLWPAARPIILLTSASLAAQASKSNPSVAANRPPELVPWFRPLTGGPILFDMPEQDWKVWRAIFNKGFASAHVMSLVPGMVAECLVYRDKLRQHARKNDMFYLDPMTLRLTMDLIGRTVLNTTLGAQKGYSVLADAMINQVRLHMANQEMNLLGYLNLKRKAQQWWNARQMDTYIGKELDQRYREYLAATGASSKCVADDASAGGHAKAAPATIPDGPAHGKSVIDLALQAYLADHPTSSAGTPATTATLDPHFRAFATRQIRLFVFAGHDSTSSSICYMLYLLATHPAALARVRAEHDAVFGRDLARLPALLAAEPQRLNELPYSLAAIKETLRLFPAASASRQGVPGAAGELHDAAIGARYPTAGAAVLILHSTLQRMPQHWPRPDDFVPERWLDARHPAAAADRHAWLPFGDGPHHCPGQALVLLEMRVLLALVAREFDVAPAYAEWDAARGERELARRKGRERRYRGERAYQVEEGAAHPADKCPFRVAFNSAYVSDLDKAGDRVGE